MIIIPAVDIKDGKCVRLHQGRFDAVTEYFSDPVEAALRWSGAGAELIHLVDLDGALAGRAVHIELIKRIISATGVEVEIGGGIRDLATAEAYLEIPGVRRIILGTAAYRDRAFLKTLASKYSHRLAVGIDSVNGYVALKGWVDVTGTKDIDFARELEGLGVGAIIFTDISRDGSLTGPNVKATCEMADSVNIPVIASGGISSIEDIKTYKGKKIEGIIVGKALYTGDVDLKEANALLAGF
ncbi:MAG: 1-(5-phosphoribosyl)-5-[(5-phosphoribosylamino)methylideneamino]imidazole-4-carboxamide isomerase [Thermodesulfobacteriota bacterium]